MKNEQKEIKYLYKYRQLYSKDGNGKIIKDDKGEIKLDEYTMNMLKIGEIYFSNPNDFNDPFDCFFPYSSEVTEEQLIEFLRSSQDKKFTSEIRSLIVKDYDVDFSRFLEDWSKLGNTTEDIRKNFIETLRIFCLAKSKKNILMWSHYAQKHEGICIGIQTHKEKEILGMYLKTKENQSNNKACSNVNTFCKVVKVKYSDTNIVIPPVNIFTTAPEDLKNFIYSKSKLWKYENEYRIPLYDNNVTEENLTYLDPEDIRKIYFGLKTPEEVIKKTIKELKENNPSNFKNIKFYKMEIKEGYYKLEPKIIE